jgi:uncharacterized hydrophobic protein (TIGR00271 family)
MVHLRIVAPVDIANAALELLEGSGSVSNVVLLAHAARKPEGHVILCDVAREDTSVIIDDLRELDVPKHGAISLEYVDTQISDAAAAAVEHAPGLASDAIIWEDVETRSEEMTELSLTFVAFMVLAMQIVAVGLILDQMILVIGGMVLGPEFGPLAALSVALVERRRSLARRAGAALAVAFPLGIALTIATVIALDLLGLIPAGFDIADTELLDFITHPDTLSLFVALVAGAAGVLSLTSAKSGALIGVLISVTTIPAAAAGAVAVAVGEWGAAGGATIQLALNLVGIVVAGVVTLFLQRRWYVSRRVKHLDDPAREAAGLPIGHSRHGVPRAVALRAQRKRARSQRP